MTINALIPENSYLYWLNLVFLLAIKPFTVGSVLFLVYLKQNRVKIDIIELMLILMLIYQAGNLIEFIFNSITDYKLGIDLALKMSNNNSNNNLLINSNDNIPRGNNANLDVPRMIRYISANLAALSARRPIGRGVGLILANGGNILADVLSSEKRANYWIDQFNFYNKNGRFRGGQNGSGPFERGTYPWDKSGNN